MSFVNSAMDGTQPSDQDIQRSNSTNLNEVNALPATHILHKLRLKTNKNKVSIKTEIKSLFILINIA